MGRMVRGTTLGGYTMLERIRSVERLPKLALVAMMLAATAFSVLIAA